MTTLNNDELRRQMLEIVLGADADSEELYVEILIDDLMQLFDARDQQLLEAILEGADYGVCTGGEWSNEKKQFVCGHNHSGIVPVEHIRSVFNKGGE